MAYVNVINMNQKAFFWYNTKSVIIHICTYISFATSLERAYREELIVVFIFLFYFKFNFEKKGKKFDSVTQCRVTLSNLARKEQTLQAKV